MKNFEVKMNNETFVMSAESQAVLESILAQSPIAYEIHEILAKKKSKVQFAENENGVCVHCHTEFNYEELDDDTKAKVDKYGLCPKCAQAYDEGQSIKQSLKDNGVATRKAPSVRTGQKPGERIRGWIKSIENALTTDIINELIDRYEGEQTFTKEKYTCIQTTLQEIIKSVRYQHGSLDIEFKYIEDNSAKKYYFVEGDHSDFSRMMINLINNAVEAVSQGRHGIIEVGFNVEKNFSGVRCFVWQKIQYMLF